MKWFFYRLIMRVAHKYGWHYAPIKRSPDGVMRWCQWCGFRENYKFVASGGLDGKPMYSGLCAAGEDFEK